jgi:hypothetical protein
MRHAGSLADAIARIELGEAGIPIGLQDAGEPREMSARMLAPAIRGVAIEHAGRRRAAEGSIVTDISPDPACLCPAQPGRQYRHGGVIGVETLPTQHVPFQRIDQRAEQCRSLAHHVRQRRAAQVDVRTGVLFRLPMQRLVVAILRHRDVGEQPSTRAATANRKLRRGRLHDCLAGPAGELGPHMTDDMEPAGDVIQDLGLVATERTQLATTGRAATVRVTRRSVFDDRARQRLW